MMIRTQVQLTERQMNALKILAHKRKVSVAELIRQAVDQAISAPQEVSLVELRQRAIALAGKYRSDQAGENVSENHDDYLADI
jgi:predicted DNA-binding ribbon-helix-helix protein